MSSSTETRERILKETRRLMEERRGQWVRVEDIAKAAGVSRQAVYLHFGSRSGLMIATARYLDTILGLNGRVENVWSQPDGLKILEAYVEFWGNYVPDVYGLAKTFMRMRDSDEAASDAWKDRMDAVYRGCKRVVDRLESDQILASVWTSEEAADFMWSTISIANWENLTIECGWSTRQYIERIGFALKAALLKA